MRGLSGSVSRACCIILDVFITVLFRIATNAYKEFLNEFTKQILYISFFRENYRDINFLYGSLMHKSDFMFLSFSP